MSTVEPPIPSKPNFLEQMLADCPLVDVHFQTGFPGVVIPAHAANGPVQMLQYGLDLNVPIPDLDLRRDGVSATMLFRDGGFLTYIPWGAIFAIFAAGSQDGYVWSQDEPAPASPSRLPEALTASGRIKAPRHLRSVPLDGPQEPLTEPRLTVNDFRVIRGGAE